jgi:hypothetical protein
MIFLVHWLQESECEELLVVRAGNRMDATGKCKK